jgi:hypothetical protein
VRFSHFLVAVLLPSASRSEVMDKEPSFAAVLGVIVVGFVAAFLASRYRPWLLAAVLPIVGAFFAAHYAELLDPAVGPAIRAEGGISYVVMSWSGLLFVVAGALIGLLVRRRFRTSARAQ